MRILALVAAAAGLLTIAAVVAVGLADERRYRRWPPCRTQRTYDGWIEWYLSWRKRRQDYTETEQALTARTQDVATPARSANP